MGPTGLPPSEMGDDVTITEADRGKVVVTPGGEVVGRVIHVREGDVYVDTAPGLAVPVRTRLGWGREEGTYRLDASAIDSVTDDEICLDI